MNAVPPSGRRADIEAALEALRVRIRRACAAAGRNPAEVELLAVTKNRPAEDLAVLLDLGLRAFGENRVQEARAKIDRLAALRPDPGDRPRWHLVGRLQRNKARSVAAWADRVESVDSVRIADALDSAARQALDHGERDGRLPVLVQLSLDADPARGGVPGDGLAALADHVASSRGLALRGLMAVAPLTVEPDRAFAALARRASALRRDHPGATVVSAGMTADLEHAIRHGSTCVRVGTALLGDRRLASR